MSTQITPATRQLLAERSGGVCEVCARRRATEASHRRPRGMGGTSIKARHLAASLLHLCHDCHQGPHGIERDREHAKSMGWLLGPLDSPTETPVWLATKYGTGWWMLDDDGCYTACETPAHV